MGSRRLSLASVLVATAVALVAAGVTVLVLGGDGSDDSEGAGVTEMPLAPQSELPESVQGIVLGSLDGGADRTLDELIDDRPVVVNFFGSWCQPCLEEMPAFERVHQDLGDQVQFVGLAENDTPDRARAVVTETGVTYATFIDPQGAALTFLEGLGMPTTVFLSPDGEVLEVHSRPLDEDGLRDRISENLGIEA
ncbi:MAG: TlpA family protein disulfide reductase [Acidimicrobiales bacterium]